MKRTRFWIGGLLLAVGGVAYAQQDDPATPEPVAVDPIYLEMEIQEQMEVKRRLDIQRMEGEAQRLTASSDELRAQAANCKARREAYEAGAPVTLCARDQADGEGAATVAAGDELARAFGVMDARLNALEAKVRDGLTDRRPVAPVAVDSSAAGVLSDGEVPSVQPVSPQASPAWLVLAGPARAVVQVRGQADIAYFKVPFEAMLDGDNCILIGTARPGLPAGTRVCRPGVANE